jgi:hypothetical protein
VIEFTEIEETEGTEATDQTGRNGETEETETLGLVFSIPCCGKTSTVKLFVGQQENLPGSVLFVSPFLPV